MVDDATAPGRQGREKVELDRGEGERPAGDVGPAALEVEAEPVGQPRGAVVGKVLGTPDCRASPGDPRDPGEELERPDRPADDVDRAGVEGGADRGLVADVGEDEQRRVAVPAEPADRLARGRVGERGVDDDHVGALLHEAGDGAVEAVRRDHLVAGRAEGAGDRADVRGMRRGDEDAEARRGGRDHRRLRSYAAGRSHAAGRSQAAGRSRGRALTRGRAALDAGAIARQGPPMRTTPSFGELLATGPIPLDGAMGSALIARGLPAGLPPEAWLLGAEGAAAVGAVHASHVAAGARIVLTATFGASPVRLADGPAAGRVADVCRAAAAIARAAVPSGVLVAGDIGPTGALLAPYGDLEPAAARAAFAEQASALAAAGVDLLWVETMADLAEARAAVEGAREAAPDLPVVATLTFERGRTLFGDRPEHAAAVLAELGVGRGRGELRDGLRGGPRGAAGPGGRARRGFRSWRRRTPGAPSRAPTARSATRRRRWTRRPTRGAPSTWARRWSAAAAGRPPSTSPRSRGRWPPAERRGASGRGPPARLPGIPGDPRAAYSAAASRR